MNNTQEGLRKAKKQRQLRRIMALLCALVLFLTTNQLEAAGRHPGALRRQAALTTRTTRAAAWTGTVCDQHVHTDACFQTRPAEEETLEPNGTMASPRTPEMDVIEALDDDIDGDADLTWLDVASGPGRGGRGGRFHARRGAQTPMSWRRSRPWTRPWTPCRPEESVEDSVRVRPYLRCPRRR